MAETQSNCPLCDKLITSNACLECSEAIFPIIATAIKKKSNKLSPFQNVDNLVFQGGGVKGVAYLGVLKALHHENENLLPNVKRIAGNSAGSILALYLGLNKEISEIEALLSGSDYSVLLDSGEIIKVSRTKMLFFTEDMYFSSKDIVLKALEFLKKLKEVTKDQEAMKKKLVNIFTAVFTYLLSKIGVFTRAAMEIFGSWFVHFLASWLIGFILPVSSEKNSQPDQNQIDMKNFLDTCQDASCQAMDNVQEMKKQLEEQGILTKEESEEEQLKDRTLNSDTLLDNEKILFYAMTELIWNCLHGKKKEHAQETPVGLFTAEKVKQELIIKPIADSLKAIGKDTEYDAKELTFREMASLKKPNGELAFRPFYVTAFNTATFRTDIFSIDHTPDVVIADAVRASMSIPLFFQSVPVCEKIPGGKPEPLKAYSCCYSDKGLTVLYMDGGILDNYPIWIFDDLKYCLNGSIPDWNPKQKVGIQNPNTLGFRLLDIDRIDNYTRPYMQHGKKLKLLQDAGNIGSYFAVIKYLTKVEFNEHEENAYAHRGDSFRTVYVYNCKISAINFALDPEQKKLLISSGYKSVELFKDRAEDSFLYEIGTIFPTKEKESIIKAPLSYF